MLEYYNGSYKCTAQFSVFCLVSVLHRKPCKHDEFDTLKTYIEVLYLMGYYGYTKGEIFNYKIGIDTNIL